MIYLLGGQGFVGSAFARLLERAGAPHVVVTRANYDEHVGSACDVLVNANGNSKKFMADRDPVWELDASVRSVARTLADFRAATYVHLSTGDVYPRQDTPEITLESATLDPARMSRYGLHKRLAEMLVCGAHPSWLVFRMGGFVGPGLKKNAIHDMLHDAPVWLTPDSELQFISTDRAAAIMWSIVEKGVRGETINLGGRGVAKIADLYARIGSKSEIAPEARRVRFELSTAKLEDVLGAPPPSTRDEIEGYLRGLGR